ncbi:MAG: cytidine deaminase [Flavobacteriaceae bacterium]
MKKINVSFELHTFASLEALPHGDKNLMEKAIGARKGAYAPYSNFQVGAAVLLRNGAVVIGSNQENASYPSGLCAERVAIFQAGALYPGEPVVSLAISAASAEYTVTEAIAPCGSCRQSISEYEVRQASPISILFMGETGVVFKCGSVADLLPLAFKNSHLKG